MSTTNSLKKFSLSFPLSSALGASYQHSKQVFNYDFYLFSLNR